MTNAQVKKTGTTTLGIRTKDVIILAADQKATMGYFAADLDTKKVYKLTDKIGLTIAGGMGDAQTLVRFLRSQAKLFEVERENAITTKALVTFIANILSGNRYYPFMVQFIIGGCTGQPLLYSMDAVGSIADVEDYTVSGSGSEFAMGVLDTQYESTMKKEEAIKLAVKAISAAKKRDVMSGGHSISIMVIDSTGVQEIPKKDVEKIIAAI
ncbi:MAG: proteasome subunit beta [Candidatus Diapherotrites archaeon]